MTLLSIKGLKAGYGSLPVLHDVDMEVLPGELVAIIGPNGAGKSTVLKAVFGLCDVTGGSVVMQGTDITGLATHELLDVGLSMVPQGRINFSRMSIEENLRLGATRLQDSRLVEERLERVYGRFPVLRSKSAELAYGLSGGQHQMLAIGRALMQEPRLLLMDEPSLGLSPKLIGDLFALIAELRSEGIAVLMVEQNAKKAIEAADRTYLLENGRVALSGKDIASHARIRSVYLGGDSDE